MNEDMYAAEQLHEDLLPSSPQSKSWLSSQGLAKFNVAAVLLNTILLIAVIAKVPGEAPSAVTPSETYTNGLCASLCAPVCVAQETNCYIPCYDACDKSGPLVRPAALGRWIETNAVQHVGLTTSNLTRSVRFYTEVLGGVEAQNAGGDGWKSDRVYQLLMQAALLRGGVAASYAANLSLAGPDVLNARYIVLGNVALELLDYRSDEAALQRRLAGPKRQKERVRRAAERVAQPVSDYDGPRSFPTFSESNVAPSVSGNMHISFNIQPSLSLNKFIDAFVETSHARGSVSHCASCSVLTPFPPLFFSSAHFFCQRVRG